ncbi:MFS transporter [Novosphingobium rosa]|uniref:permease n=1 Tax=Novosphingobium rosa TaxID=76978 RepID=UPI000A9757F1
MPFVPDAIAVQAPHNRRLMALFAVLGFSAGLPFYLFATVLFLRLARHGVDLTIIGFFGWVSLLPTFKFAWAPLLDRFAAPGFTRFWGLRRGWIMLAQLGIGISIVGLALADPDRNLAVTAFWAVLLAFWTTTVEIAADAWRVELAPDAATQGPLSAANLWGYRSAMVAAGSGTLIIADHWGWTLAYLAIAVTACCAFPLVAITARDEHATTASRWNALGVGALATLVAYLAVAVLAAAVGWAVLGMAQQMGIGAKSNVTTPVLVIALLPFVLMALALPRIRRMGPEAPLRRSAALGPYIDIFWRFGYGSMVLLGFVAFYRMGDVLALNMSKPLINAVGYTLTQVGLADSWVALATSMAGVALAGWMVTRWPYGLSLTIGATLSAIGNYSFVWLYHMPVAPWVLYVATGLEQFGHGFEGTVFVVYLSLLVNPRYAGSQYAFFSGFAFLLPRLIAGAAGALTKVIGYDGIFVISGTLTLAPLIFLPFLARLKPRMATDL